MTLLRRNVVIVLACVIFLTLVYKHQNLYAVQKSARRRRGNSTYNNERSDYRVASPGKLRNTKTIQWFDTYHDGHGLRMKAHNVRLDQCEYNNCELLEHNIVPERDNKIYGPLSADAVIFQGCHLGQFLPPDRRDDNQVFVFAERETWWYMGAFERMMDPALNKTEKLKKEKTFSMQIPDVLKHPSKYFNIFRFRSVFNWTMTYRRDSDIYMPYGEILSKRDAITRKYISRFEVKTDEKDYDRIFYRKTKEVVWLVSDCETKSKREYYVQRMSKYINVDIYGACGTLSCPKGKYEDSDKDNCLNKIIRDYKFILSFENTFHTDYVTEKLFDWFPRDIVQIAYGMADYESITPPGTVINAANFISPQDLANFLNRLAVDKNKYVKYLRNKDRHYSAGLDEMQQKAYCNLCEKLNHLDKNRRAYPNIGLWWQLNDTSAFQDLYLQAFGVEDKKQNKVIKYVFYFIMFLCTCAFFTVTYSYLKGGKHNS
ncbi:alpha-(1,3)-fucosyltransferase C-like [Mercenaria mercenaria]|uniref:alpha-(1,3)-fucosyltransferase C-like n=1 Tax=Mercenaria mercenaria TaxID=6596 RepID=UPI001E1D685C|nr:alpha-(1,3)-fucosyltransferase C-like [Mercenaria mercenaria]